MAVQLCKLADLCRVQWFTIATQFQAIFGHHEPARTGSAAAASDMLEHSCSTVARATGAVGGGEVLLEAVTTGQPAAALVVVQTVREGSLWVPATSAGVAQHAHSEAVPRVRLSCMRHAACGMRQRTQLAVLCCAASAFAAGAVVFVAAE